ncbi:MAG TPA: biopolymer transporter ExbD [Saprospiraceae bacterium]|nr:biopolymer transporter ExbD [Lewinellaceae bacterium]HPQ21933.1 biopolymer transporter ExbD [Saprospiraceae bacterium]
MAIKKRNKVSAEFNMSSLTDIIFLLLIFFMLTSSMIVPSALNLSLPGKKSTNNSTPTTPVIISIEGNGNYFMNDTRISLSDARKQMMDLKRDKGDKAAITIRPSKQASNDAVVAIMDIAYKNKISAVLDSPH